MYLMKIYDMIHVFALLFYSKYLDQMSNELYMNNHCRSLLMNPFLRIALFETISLISHSITILIVVWDIFYQNFI